MAELSGYLRPIGFRPWEISAMINQEVIDQHAEEAAFLWTQRDHAVRAPQYALKDLATLDERVEAHVDGLRVAGAAGWKTASSQMDQGAGEVFAASVLAFESGELEQVGRVLETAGSNPALARGLVSALGWIDAAAALRETRMLVSSQAPEVRRAGIAGMAIRRVDPGPVLDQALEDEYPSLAARALRAAGELGRTDLLPRISQRSNDANGECRFWAAWAAVRLGDLHSKAIEIVQESVEQAQPQAERAVNLACRVIAPKDAHGWFMRLAEKPETARFGVMGAGVIGDPGSIPWLIAQMENPALSRVAGAAFSMITGADLAYEDLDSDAPVVHAEESDEDFFSPDPDSDLKWPNPAAVTKWWVQRSANFVPGVRYLLGQPITDETLHEALARGKQTQRMAAAMELALRHPGDVLFETRARAPWQLAMVKQWSS